MVKVEYFGDPNAAISKNHTSALHRCKEKMSCEFETAGEAINFRLECTYGITPLEQLMTKDEFPIAEERFITLGDVVIEGEINDLEEE